MSVGPVQLFKGAVVSMFSFQVKTKIVFGLDAVKQIGNEARGAGFHKVLIATDKGIVKAGLLKQVEEILTSESIECAVFDEIQPSPQEKTVLRGAECFIDEQADVVIGLGGGSAMDAAKAIAVMATNAGPIESLCGAFDPWPNPPKPIFAIPTTAGTGSEVSAVALIAPGKGKKMVLMGRSILPSVAFCDPLLTVSLPPKLTATTGIDALSHALEAYVGIRRPNPFTDILAERAIELVACSLRKAFANGADIKARSDMLLASTMGLMAAANTGGLGIVHALTQAIDGPYGLPHARVIAACLPFGLEYNAIAVPEKYAKVSKLMGVDTTGMSDLRAAKMAAGAVRELLQDLGLEENLGSMGVNREDIPKLAKSAMEAGSTPANPRRLDLDAFISVFERMIK